VNGPLAAGQRLGRYELVCPAGQGGMATVWLARLVGTRGFHKPVALKIMLPSVREDPDSERMFQSEAALASRIRHPNVVEILDFGEENDMLYIVMEWIHGESLSQVLTGASKRGGMPLGVAVRIGSQIGAGLHAAHELTDEAGKPLGVVHRDVSPQNVLIGFNGTVKLVDFGIAKVTAEATHLTDMGMVRGKVAYMAPEQIRLERLDRRTDVFAAGILLYVMTTGRHPFKREERADTAFAICQETPVCRPTQLNENYPERLERVVMRALAKAPEDRQPTAQELADELLRTMPPSRGNPQEELQKYMADLLPDRLVHHQELIRRALGVNGITGAITGLPKTAHSSSTLRAVSVSDSTSNVPIEGGSAPGSVPTPSTTSPGLRPKRRASTALLAIAAGAVAGAVTIAAVTGVRHGGAAATSPVPAARPLVASRAPGEHAAEIPVTETSAETPAPSASAALAAPGAADAKRTTKKASRAAPRRSGAKESAPSNQGTGLKDPYSQ
jgi:serine/threonine protein kinase